jgi:hypothetical protein
MESFEFFVDGDGGVGVVNVADEHELQEMMIDGIPLKGEVLMLAASLWDDSPEIVTKEARWLRSCRASRYPVVPKMFSRS